MLNSNVFSMHDASSSSTEKAGKLWEAIHKHEDIVSLSVVDINDIRWPSFGLHIHHRVRQTH